MKKTIWNSILALGIILIIMGVSFFILSIFLFLGICGNIYWYSSRSSTTYGYGHFYLGDSLGFCCMIWFVVFISVGAVLIANYTAYKKESDKQKMEKMIEEKYGIQGSLPTSKPKIVQIAQKISKSIEKKYGNEDETVEINKPKIVHCTSCNTEIECYENQQIIRCPQCGKTYKNPYYKEK